jgi:hypothetical protein
VVYKLYCGILNARLTVKLDDMEVKNDEQNASRKGRSTIDHLDVILEYNIKNILLLTFAASSKYSSLQNNKSYAFLKYINAQNVKFYFYYFF